MGHFEVYGQCTPNPFKNTDGYQISMILFCALLKILNLFIGLSPINIWLTQESITDFSK